MYIGSNDLPYVGLPTRNRHRWMDDPCRVGVVVGALPGGGVPVGRDLPPSTLGQPFRLKVGQVHSSLLKKSISDRTLCVLRIIRRPRGAGATF